VKTQTRLILCTAICALGLFALASVPLGTQGRSTQFAKATDEDPREGISRPSVSASILGKDQDNPIDMNGVITGPLAAPTPPGDPDRPIPMDDVTNAEQLREYCRPTPRRLMDTLRDLRSRKETDRSGGCKYQVGLKEKIRLVIAALKNCGVHVDPAPIDSSEDCPPKVASVESKSGNGLKIVTFDTVPGRIIVNLPDDMRAGDTISGTVVAEPRGETPDERERNLNELKSKAFEIKDFSFGVENPTTIGSATGGAGPGRIPVGVNQPFSLNVPRVTSRTPADKIAIRFLLVGPGSDNDMPPMFEIKDFSFGAEHPTTSGNATGGSAGRPSVSDFKIPTLGQQGRPLEIFGPFDGNASNTTVRFGPAGSTVPDFEKNTENVSGGFGLIRPLAESPRKIVAESPSNVVGPIQVFVNEGDKKTTGAHRNLGINLSAPKTNLQREERTTVTVEVRGLEGITKDVPLQLDSKGVITMEGGSFQNLRIKPSDVTPDGRYTTNRTITGVQAGGFSVNGTVIVRPYDLCLQDDSDPNRLFHFNSFTGDYIFACGGGSCRSGTGGTSGQPPTGSSAPPTPVNLTGTGKMQMKGCIITLSHNAPDRRVFARLDACTKSGDASVETTSPKTNFKITDKNTADNTVASPPPK
jgi:hypothetical protein